MEEPTAAADVHLATQRFGAPRPRAHTGWAIAAASAYLASVSLLAAFRDVLPEGAMAVLMCVVMFGGLALLPFGARRFDEGLARFRGDTRPLHKPYLASTGAFAGIILGPLALIFAVVLTIGRFSPGTGGQWTVLAALCGASFGAHLVARGRPHAWTLSLGFDALTYVVDTHAEVVRWRDITALHPFDAGVEVHRVGGEPLRIPFTDAGVPGVTIVGALEARLAAAHAAFPLGPALHRNDRPLDDWRDALHGRVLGGADFRATPLERDDLEAALVHPAATPEERIGAALALHALDTTGTQRVRIAAASAMDPSLREALKAVTEGTVDAPRCWPPSANM